MYAGFLKKFYLCMYHKIKTFEDEIQNLFRCEILNLTVYKS